MNQFTIKTYLTVKAASAEEAQKLVEVRLNKWFTTPPLQPPFPEGTLLLFSTEITQISTVEVWRK